MGKKRNREGEAVSTDTETMWEEDDDAFFAGLLAEVTAQLGLSADEVASRKEERIKRAPEATAAYLKRMLEEKKEDEEPEDLYAIQASNLRGGWTDLWGGDFGSFEDTTLIDSMRFTDMVPVPSYACTLQTLQMFSIKVAAIREGLKWPLHIYGFVAVRDYVDHNRNIIFSRTRDNCQILNEKDSSLVLTVPSRAVVILSPVTLEVELKVKGSSKSEDKVLSFIAAGYGFQNYEKSRLVSTDYSSMLSTLEFTYAHVVRSVEATVIVEITEGSWPENFHGQVAVCTASTGDKKFVLLDSGDDKVPVASDGTVELSRRVACVELKGQLTIHVKTWKGEGENTIELVEDKAVFKPKEASRSYGECDMGFCKLKITIAWSLLSYYPQSTRLFED